MLKTALKPEIRDLVEHRDWARLRQALRDWPAAEVADLILDVDRAERVLIFRALDRNQAADVFSHLSPEQQANLIDDLRDEETGQLLANLSPDDRTHLFEELPGNVTQQLMHLLSPEDLKEARKLLGYPEESVGRLMTPEYVAVKADWKVERALGHVRKRARQSETINRVYVVDEKWRLIDDIELRRLFMADPEITVADVMDHSFVYVRTHDDREEAARVIQRYDIFALPVVDSSGVLVGMVTVDDLIDVVEQEATEDFHKIATVAPIRMSLREAPFRLLYRRRVGWLLVLVFMNIFSGEGIAYFENTIEAVVALVFFLPLLIDSGGNAGSQSATLIVRALATGDVRMADWLKMLAREIGVALALGLTMAAGVILIASFRAPNIMIVVGITMVIVVLVGSLVGMLLPFVLTKLQYDPAAASAPLITSIADISGVVIYFSVATWYLEI